MNSKHVLVTGAAGFIGSHLVEALVNAGATTIAFVRYRSDNGLGNLQQLPSDILNQIEVLRGDLRDPAAVGSAVARADVVFHLGALNSVPQSFRNPTEYAAVNTLGTAHVLQACTERSVERLLMMSTSEVYGRAQYLPMDERHPLCARSPYAASKIGAEKLAESYFYSFGLPVVVVRGFNVFGPRQSARGVIPTLLTQAVAGEHVKLGNMDPVRDYTFVTDTVRALLAVVAEPRAIGQVVNIGTGRGTSVRELVRETEQIIGHALVVETDAERVRTSTREVDQLVASAERLREWTGWSPTVSLTEGLTRVRDWLTAHEQLGPSRQYGWQ